MLEKEFLLLIADALEVDIMNLSIDTSLHDIEEWDSIGQLSFIGVIDDNFSIDIDIEEIEKCETISQLFDYVNGVKG